MNRSLMLRIAKAIITALVVLAAMTHIVIFLIAQAMADTITALTVVLALFVADALCLIRLLGIVADVVVDGDVSQ